MKTVKNNWKQINETKRKVKWRTLLSVDKMETQKWISYVRYQLL